MPIVTDKHELVDVKFNVDTYQKVGSDEPAYYLQFRHGAEKYNPDIGVGSYVYMADEDGDWKWWLMVSFDERPQFRQYHIVETNYKLGWVVDNTIYYHLVVLRGGSSGDIDENSYTSIVDGTLSVWLPTTNDAVTIGYNQRFLISDKRRVVPLAWEVSKIEETHPFGITKLKLKQSTFNPSADDAESMLADYSSDGIDPVEPSIEFSGNATISYSGTKPTIKVGGSTKTFTPTFSIKGTTVAQWLLRYKDGEIPEEEIEYYTVEYQDNLLMLSVAQNYNLVSKVLIIQVVGSDGSTAEVSVEVI